MPWFNRIQPPTYKGVPLDIKTYSIAGGKKGKDSDYANAEGGGAEDLGSKQRKITVTGVVGGADYDVTRAALEAVLATPGAGELVLPMGQQSQCLPTAWQFTEGYIEKAGVADYTITFIEITQPTLPLSVPETLACDLGGNRSIDIIGANLRGIGVTSMLQKITQTLDAVARQVGSVVDPAYFTASAVITETQRALAAANPEALFASVVALARVVVDGSDSVRRGVERLGAAWGVVGSVAPDPVLEQREKVAECRTIEAVGAAFMIAGAEAGLDGEYGTRDDALAVAGALREQYTTWRDRLQALEGGVYGNPGVVVNNRFTVSQQLNESILGIITATVTELERRAVGLPGQQVITLEDEADALTLAFTLYGDPGRADDLITDNGINTPDAIPAGTVIKYRDGVVAA